VVRSGLLFKLLATDVPHLLSDGVLPAMDLSQLLARCINSVRDENARIKDLLLNLSSFFVLFEQLWFQFRFLSQYLIENSLRCTDHLLSLI